MTVDADPLPLNPDSPDVEVVTGPVASLLRALWPGGLDGVIDSPVAIPRPVTLTWEELSLSCGDVTWKLDAGGLDLELSRPAFDGDEQLDRMFRVMNQPADFVLDGGSSLTARLAHLVSRGSNIDVEKKMAATTYRLSLNSWTWWPPRNEALWVGRLDGTRIDDGNLVVCGDGWWTSTCYRLSGAYDLYLVNKRKAQTTTLVVDTRGRPLDQSLLGTDFVALEFALGRPLRLDHLVAFNEQHEVVGAAGLEFGSWSGRGSSGRCPVAVAMDLYANYGEVASEHLWVPLLFAVLARRLSEEGPDSQLLNAVAAYLDSIAAGNIHVSYLLVQIALEALSTDIVRPKTGVLVADPKKWVAFVRKHEAEIRSLAIEKGAAQKLVNKVLSAQQAPSTDRVLAALRHFDLEVPPAVLAEVARRNSSAHQFVMAKESTADVQELADRLALVQTLLVAIVAKHIGFKGPIIGWEWVRGRHKIPEWWSWEKLDDARRRFLVPPEAKEAD